MSPRAGGSSTPIWPCPPGKAARIPCPRGSIEVLRGAAQGADPAEIATVLHLSVGTVRNYLTNIVTKMNARNRVDAIRAAREAGWLP